MKRKLLSIFMCALAAVCAFAFTACKDDDANGSKVYDPGKSDYIIEDVMKENSMFDTEKLFNEKVKYEEVELSALPANMTAIKYESVGYDINEHTYPFAVYGVPNTPMPEGGYPAIVLIHGGAGHVYTDWIKYWNEKGYVAIAPDMFANMLDNFGQKTLNPDGGPDETHSGSCNDDVDDYTNSWVYHSVVNIIYCNNILRSMENVNANQIGVTGISWGGVVTLIVSGVDKRFAAFAPVYAAGGLYKDSFQHGSFGGDDRDKWIDRYDPSAYVPYATKPMFFVSGVDDNCFSVVNRAETHALARCKTFYSQRSGYMHGYFWKESAEIYYFMQHILRGEDQMIHFSDVTLSGGKAKVTIKNPEMAESVRLLYTTDDDFDSHNWRFNSIEIGVGDGNISVDLPAGTTAFTFEALNMGLDINYRMSSELIVSE